MNLEQSKRRKTQRGKCNMRQGKENFKEEAKRVRRFEETKAFEFAK